jgi:hypothetical protein
MKTLIMLLALLLLVKVAPAQTVDEILARHYANTGGKARWDTLRNVRMKGTVLTQGMEIPVTILQTADGKQKVSIQFQGQEITQVAFNGEQGWNMNFMTQQPERMSPEANANMKQQVTDFPDALINYKRKGYMATMEGKEAIEGKAAYKVKLVKSPLKLGGREQENVVYYFFDPDNYLLVAMRNTSLGEQARGTSVETLLDDYRTVNGLLFPFASQISYNGQPGEAIQLQSIETNVEVDPVQFAFPAR